MNKKDWRKKLLEQDVNLIKKKGRNKLNKKI